MSAGFLTAKVYQLLKSKPDNLKPTLAQLASEIRLTLEWLGYEVEEKLAGSSTREAEERSAESPTARLRLTFKNGVETFNLLLQVGKPKLIERHATGYLRQKKDGSVGSSGGGERFGEELLSQLVKTLRQYSFPLPVLEIEWRYSWPQLLDVLPYPSIDSPVALTFDRVIGRTSGPHRSMCRITIMSREITCAHLLNLLKTIIPSRA
jgi:hypothetical protein